MLSTKQSEVVHDFHDRQREGFPMVDEVNI